MITDKLYDSVRKIWEEYFTHPFIRGICDGTIEQEKFVYYTKQDYYYLHEYAKVILLGVAKTGNDANNAFFLRMVNFTMTNELSIYRRILKAFGVTREEMNAIKPSHENISYYKFMQGIAYDNEALGIAVILLSASWSYDEIGKFVKSHFKGSKNSFLNIWVDGYGSKEYKKKNQKLVDVIDRMSEGCSEKTLDRLIGIMITTSRYEKKFWDMAYQMEQ